MYNKTLDLIKIKKILCYPKSCERVMFNQSEETHTLGSFSDLWTQIKPNPLKR